MKATIECPRALQDWTLAAIVEVEHADRIQCQCDGCGHIVFRRIHLIVWADGRIECWGSTCFRRSIGAECSGVTPLYSGAGGRRLADDERKLLKANRERLIAKFRADEERARRAAADRATQKLRDAEERRASMVAAEAERYRHEQVEEERRSAVVAQRLATAARDIAVDKRARSAVQQGRRQSILPMASKFAHEPLDDPLYDQIRASVAAEWEANGIDINRAGQRVMFLENVRARYARARGPKRV